MSGYGSKTPDPSHSYDHEDIELHQEERLMQAESLE
jgi:hypothetical protein